MEEKIESALKIRNLTVVFSDEKTGETIKALDGVDLQVGKGVIYGIFGKKGSGKTTLMNVLTGTEEADSGEITIFGEPSAAASARLKTGFVTAEPEF
ncbi:MAG: ATP-binding cassette domain-containing protein, partial [bacterium]|nr:ATP-binding cassette domain-containing protein [bacterium]